jgi:hypothetical protein
VAELVAVEAVEFFLVMAGCSVMLGAVDAMPMLVDQYALL